MYIGQRRQKAAEGALAVAADFVPHVVVREGAVAAQIHPVEPHPLAHALGDERDGGMHE